MPMEKTFLLLFEELFPHLKSEDELGDHYHCILLQNYWCDLNHAGQWIQNLSLKIE